MNVAEKKIMSKGVMNRFEVINALQAARIKDPAGGWRTARTMYNLAPVDKMTAEEETKKRQFDYAVKEYIALDLVEKQKFTVTRGGGGGWGWEYRWAGSDDVTIPIPIPAPGGAENPSNVQAVAMTPLVLGKDIVIVSTAAPTRQVDHETVRRTEAATAKATTPAPTPPTVAARDIAFDFLAAELEKRRVAIKAIDEEIDALRVRQQALAVDIEHLARTTDILVDG